MQTNLTWQSIDSAPKDGSPIIYMFRRDVISTCIWLVDGWWDTRAEEEAFPTEWILIGSMA